MPGGKNGRSGTAVFRENFVAIGTQDRRLWIWIYLWIYMDIWISMDICWKSVKMDINMDNKFHIHGKPGGHRSGPMNLGVSCASRAIVYCARCAGALSCWKM